MIITLALLRIIPYLLSGLLAYQKGYKRLTVAMLCTIAVALFNYSFTPPEEVRVVFSGIIALLIFWHAADLTSRKK